MQLSELIYVRHKYWDEEKLFLEIALLEVHQNLEFRRVEVSSEGYAFCLDGFSPRALDPLPLEKFRYIGQP